MLSDAECYRCGRNDVVGSFVVYKHPPQFYCNRHTPTAQEIVKAAIDAGIPCAVCMAPSSGKYRSTFYCDEHYPTPRSEEQMGETNVPSRATREVRIEALGAAVELNAPSYRGTKLENAAIMDLASEFEQWIWRNRDNDSEEAK